jgi:hypothetical protein
MPGINHTAEYFRADLRQTPAALGVEMPIETAVGVCCWTHSQTRSHLVTILEMFMLGLKMADPGADWLPNGCELPVLGPQAQVSGRGSLSHIQLLAHASRLPVASVVESPVRSSELLDGLVIDVRPAPSNSNQSSRVFFRLDRGGQSAKPPILASRGLYIPRRENAIHLHWAKAAILRRNPYG